MACVLTENEIKVLAKELNFVQDLKSLIVYKSKMTLKNWEEILS